MIFCNAIGGTDSQCVADADPGRDETAALTASDDMQFLGTEEDIGHQYPDSGAFCQHCSQCRAFHAHAGARDENLHAGQCQCSRRIDEHEVEADVQNAHYDTHDAGNLHVAAALQHSCAEKFELEGRQSRHDYHEIHSGVVTYLLGTSQPSRQCLADADACQ